MRSLRPWLKLISRRDVNRCWVVDGCDQPPIKAHSIPRWILNAMAVNGHVLTMSLDHRSPNAEVTPRLIGINRASVGGFACREHDDWFKKIDQRFDIADHEALSLVFLRSVLKEIWTLENVIHNIPTDKRADWYDALSYHGAFTTRLKALREVRNRLARCLSDDGCVSGASCQIQHRTRIIKTSQAVTAGSNAQGEYERLLIDGTNIEVEIGLNATNPNASWGFSVFPFTDGHIVVISTIRGSKSHRFFDHIVSAQGRELEEAVSIELMRFCENWMINPAIWDLYGAKKRRSVIEAFDNFDDLVSDKYRYSPRQKWWDQVSVPNRHELNIFRYRQAG